MWMLLIVKLLSFKRYNYPFYKCRENGRQMQCAYSQCFNDKVVPLIFSLFCQIPRDKCKAHEDNAPIAFRMLLGQAAAHIRAISCTHDSAVVFLDYLSHSLWASFITFSALPMA